MSEKAKEARTAVMIMVKASWEDQSGTLHTCSARMENRSSGGACIRLRQPVHVGAKLHLQWRWEEFKGTSRYCRSDGRDYLVGIQRDAREQANAVKAKDASLNEGEKRAEEMVTAPVPGDLEGERIAQPRRETQKRAESNIPEREARVSMPAIAVQTARASGTGRSLPEPSKPEIVVLRKTEQGPRPKEQRAEASKEKHMGRRWFELGHKEQKQNDGSLNVTGAGASSVAEPAFQAAHTAPAQDKTPEANEGSGSSIELLSMPDIYQTAGILNPRKGYSILKVAEMVRSEHLRGLSKEMKRASILVALDAAGISVDEVAQDAKVRMEAIDAYETAQRKQFETLLARKAEENQQIMAELERIKATYAERLRRNLEGVAREKATFGNWLTTKQQEAANISEALELCLKQETIEPASSPLDTSLVSANAKPV
jgi:hypothetical protein